MQLLFVQNARSNNENIVAIWTTYLAKYPKDPTSDEFEGI